MHKLKVASTFSPPVSSFQESHTCGVRKAGPGRPTIQSRPIYRPIHTCLSSSLVSLSLEVRFVYGFVGGGEMIVHVYNPERILSSHSSSSPCKNIGNKSTLSRLHEEEASKPPPSPKLLRPSVFKGFNNSKPPAES